jgi:hypothetical protein
MPVFEQHATERHTARVDVVFPRACSGDMYAGVPRAIRCGSRRREHPRHTEVQELGAERIAVAEEDVVSHVA